MSYCSTVISQLFGMVSRLEFESLARKHHVGQRLRRFNRWTQFVAMTSGQLSGCSSLRDIESTMQVHSGKSYHLGTARVSRSTLARVNDVQPYSLYEALFGKLLHRCKGRVPKHDFKFDNKLYSLDATTIDLCLNLFPWAKFRTAKGGIKINVGLDHDGYMPTFVHVGNARQHEISSAKDFNFPTGSIVVFDRGYIDYGFFNSLINKGNFFVTRMKSNTCFEPGDFRKADVEHGVTLDQDIALSGEEGRKCRHKLRMVGYTDAKTGKKYSFITNAFHLDARTIADIYKNRWQIELFFKWIKQNLKIKTFLGTSRNAVLTQVWIALCAYLLIAYVAFTNKTGMSMRQVLRHIKAAVFETRLLDDLWKPPKPKPAMDLTWPRMFK